MDETCRTPCARGERLTVVVLGISSNEKKATHCKIICLMQLDKFDEALTTIVKNAVDTAYVGMLSIALIDRAVRRVGI